MRNQTTLLALLLLVSSLETVFAVKHGRRLVGADPHHFLRRDPAAATRVMKQDDKKRKGPAGPQFGAPTPSETGAGDANTADSSHGDMNVGTLSAPDDSSSGPSVTDVAASPSDTPPDAAAPSTVNDAVPCVSMTLSLEYSFKVGASDEDDASKVGDYVEKTVQKVFASDLVTDGIDCTKASVQNIDYEQPNLQTESCTLESQTSSSDSCFRMAAGLMLDYTGPRDEMEQMLQTALDLFPTAFSTMSGSNEIEFLNATLVPLSEAGNMKNEVGDDAGGKKNDDDNAGAGGKKTDDDNTGGKAEDDASKGGETTNSPKKDTEGQTSDAGGKSQADSGGATDGKTENSGRDEPPIDDATTGGGKADGESDGNSTGNDDSTLNDNQGKPGRTSMSKAARIFVTCFLLAIILTVILLIIFFIKKRQDRGKTRQLNMTPDVEQAPSKDTQRLSPKDTESTAGDNQSFDSAFFHCANKMDDESSGVSDDDYSHAYSSQATILATGKSIHERYTNPPPQRGPPQTESLRILSQKAMPLNKFESPPSSPTSSHDASVRSFSVQGSPILANESDYADHSVLYDVIMTPAGRITRVHVETMDAVDDRERNAKFYNNSDKKLLQRSRTSPTEVSRVDQNSMYVSDTTHDVSRSSSSPSLYFSRSRSLFDCDDTVDLSPIGISLAQIQASAPRYKQMKSINNLLSLLISISALAPIARAGSGIRQANNTWQVRPSSIQGAAVKRRLQGPGSDKEDAAPEETTDRNEKDVAPPEQGNDNKDAVANDVKRTDSPTVSPTKELREDRTRAEEVDDDDAGDDDKNKDETPSDVEDTEEVVPDQNDDDDQADQGALILDGDDAMENVTATDNAATFNCSSSQSIESWLEVTYEIIASNESAAMRIGSKIHGVVGTRLERQLGGFTDASINTTVTNSSECPLQIDEIKLYVPSLTEEPCSGSNSDIGDNDTLACYQVYSVLRLTYDGPSKYEDALILDAIDAMPSVFRNLTAVELIDAVIYAPDKVAAQESDDDVVTSNTETSNSTTGDRKPTGVIFLSMAVVALAGTAAGVIVRRQRQKRRKPSESLVDRIKIMSTQRTLNVSVDNVRLSDETFQDDSFNDDGLSVPAYSPQTTPEKSRYHGSRLNASHTTDHDIELFESFEVDERGRTFECQEYVVKGLDRSYSGVDSNADTVAF
ncbi:hypothetical protein MPSEU_000961000 [Mayamaea pseudoterrestris]|nr:hypothetical protein MPSEU_000961000 [Mayamaea pseudoterrestris]